jgi:hypothetical protein
MGNIVVYDKKVTLRGFIVIISNNMLACPGKDIGYFNEIMLVHHTHIFFQLTGFIDIHKLVFFKKRITLQEGVWICIHFFTPIQIHASIIRYHILKESKRGNPIEINCRYDFFAKKIRKPKKIIIYPKEICSYLY